MPSKSLNFTLSYSPDLFQSISSAFTSQISAFIAGSTENLAKELEEEKQKTADLERQLAEVQRQLYESQRDARTAADAYRKMNTELAAVTTAQKMAEARAKLATSKLSELRRNSVSGAGVQGLVEDLQDWNKAGAHLRRPVVDEKAQSKITALERELTVERKNRLDSKAKWKEKKTALQESVAELVETVHGLEQQVSAGKAVKKEWKREKKELEETVEELREEVRTEKIRASLKRTTGKPL